MKRVQGIGESGSSNLSRFQAECSQRVGAFLDKEGLRWKSRHVLGETELYVLIDVDGLGDHRVEIYIYVNEAGFFLDDEWTIFESQDFSEDRQLQDELIAVLRSRLHSLLLDEG